MLVNLLGTDALLSSIVQVLIDLLWVPVLADHLFNSSLYSIQNAGTRIWALREYASRCAGFSWCPRRLLLR